MRNPSRQIKMKTVVWHDNKLTLKSHKKRGENIYLMLGCHKRVKLLNQEVHLFWCSHNEAIEIKRDVGNLDSRWLDTIFLKNHPFSSYFLFAEVVYLCIALHIRYEVSIFLSNLNLENCNPIVTIFKFNLSLTTFATFLFDNRWRRFIFFFVIECSMTIQNLFHSQWHQWRCAKKGAAPQKIQISWLSDSNFQDWNSTEK